MKNKESIYDVSAELERKFGPRGSDSRKAAEDKAWEEYNAQILLDARKNAGLTQQELADRIGVHEFVLIPSSIHECLFLPDDEGADVDTLRMMVREVNETQVAPEEVLSDSVYRYDPETDAVVIA